MKKTMTDRVIAYLIYKGCVEIPSTSNKYRKFQLGSGQTVGGKPSFYFVGKKGACRAGKSASDSFSVSDAVQRYMLAWEEKVEKDKKNMEEYGE
jgi:hypothetical protein